MPIMFWDGPCPKCNGTGYTGKVRFHECRRCGGSGIVGGVQEVPDMPREIDLLGAGPKLCKVREQRRVSMSDLAKEFDWPIVHLSDIERGRAKPNVIELRQMEEWINGTVL